MTVVSEAKIRARRTQKAPTMKATTDQLVTRPSTTTGTPARTAMPYAPPSVPPMNAAVLKKRALATLTSRTRPDDWRVNRVRVTLIPDSSRYRSWARFARNLQPIGLFVKDASGERLMERDVTNN